MSCSPRLRISRTAMTPAAPAPTSRTGGRRRPPPAAARLRLTSRSHSARRSTRRPSRPPKASTALMTMIEMGIRRAVRGSGRKRRKARSAVAEPSAARTKAGTSAIPTYFHTNDSTPLM